MHRPHTHTAALLVVVAVLVASPVAATSGSSSSSSFFGGAVGDGNGGFLSGVLIHAAKAIAGVTGRVAHVDVPFVGPKDGTASQYATNFREQFQAHNRSIAAYGSERLDPTAQYDTFALYFHDKQGHNETVYVVSDVSNGMWTHARALTPEEFNKTGRTPDHWVSLDWYASKNAASELKTFEQKNVVPNKNVSHVQAAKLIGEYGNGLKSDMWNGSVTS